MFLCHSFGAEAVNEFHIAVERNRNRAKLYTSIYCVPFSDLRNECFPLYVCLML